MPHKNFDRLQEEFERAFSDFQASLNFKERHELLVELQKLIEEADEISFEDTPN